MNPPCCPVRPKHTESRQTKGLSICVGTALYLFSQLSSAVAAVYYVSSSQGSDTNSGTSIDAPWQSLTNVYRHQWEFNPGDSLLLKAGDTFGDPLSLNKGGAPGSPITIDRYGSGPNPIIYGDHPNAIWTAVPGHPGIYSTYLGVPGYVGVGKVYDASGNRYAHLLQGTNTLDSFLSTFTNSVWGANDTAGGNIIYLKTPDGNSPPKMHLFQSTTVGFMGGYHVIQNLEVCNGGIGIIVNGTGEIIRNNYIHDGYNNGIFLYKSAFSEATSNTVMRTGETQIYLQNGGNNWVHHNICSRSGGDATGYSILGCHFPAGEQAGIGLETGTNNIIEYNSLSYCYGSFFDYFYEVDTVVRYNDCSHASMAAAPMGTGLKVHHNIFNVGGNGSGLSCSHSYDAGISPAPDSGTNLIYNNVIYNVQGAFYTRGSGGIGVTFRNNLVVSTSPSFSFVNVSPGVNSDYNVFYCTTGTPLGWVWNDTNLFTTLTAFRTGTGQETHSVYANPQFVSTNPVVASDFRLRAGSPCVDVGLDLKSVGLLAPTYAYKDFMGSAIPQDAGPDIGPYEVAAPRQPANLHIIGSQ